MYFDSRVTLEGDVCNYCALNKLEKEVRLFHK